MHRLSFAPAGSDAHHRDCDALASRGVTVPFVHAAATAEALARPLDRWCTLRDAEDAPVAGAVVRVERSRKLPWVRLARLEQAGALLAATAATLPGGARDLVAALGREIPSLGRLTVQCYALEHERLAEQVAIAERAGLAAADAVGYTRTLRLTLPPAEDALLARLSASARRNLREVGTGGFSVRALTAESLAPRLQQLLDVAHARTGGVAGAVPWSAQLRTAASDPGRSVILGIFHPERQGDAALVGFAQGTVTDGGVAYAVAGTERAPDIGRTPLSYALVWELLRWAQRAGHAWFDFGGVTPADQPEHPLAGISAFKRRFGGEECVVAAELRAGPHATSARLLAAGESLLTRR